MLDDAHTGGLVTHLFSKEDANGLHVRLYRLSKISRSTGFNCTFLPLKRHLLSDAQPSIALIFGASSCSRDDLAYAFRAHGRKLFRTLCCGIALVFGVHFPAYGCHDRSIVSADRTCTSITEFKMLRSIECIKVIDSSPRENDPLANVDCSCPGCPSDGDIAFESESYIGNHNPLSGYFVWHFKTQRRSVLNLEFGSDAVCDLARRRTKRKLRPSIAR
jgi:hypothetical protein